MDSGWNCTAASGRVRCSTAMTTPSSLSAVTTRSAGRSRIANRSGSVRPKALGSPRTAAPPTTRTREALPCIGQSRTPSAPRNARPCPAARGRRRTTGRPRSKRARACPRRRSPARPGPGDSTTRSGRGRRARPRETGAQASSPRRPSDGSNWRACARRSPGGRPAACACPPRAAPARSVARARPSASAGRRRASRKAEALRCVSRSSASGSESKSSVAPARTWAMPSLTRMVRSVSPVFRLPSKPTWPTAPPYQARASARGPR